MKTVIEMAREAETYATNEYMRLRDEAICEEYLDVNWHELRDELRDERFAALVRADEREACMNALNALPYQRSTKYDCMDAIRARGETK